MTLSTATHTDVAVIGGGIVGLATARALLHGGITDSVQLLEKEPATARHQSTRNSGVLHCGLQYQPGSAKARLAREGIRAMTEYCRHHGIAHEICGKLVVATRQEQLPWLDEMLARGQANGLQGLRKLTAAEAREIEPHAACVAAIHVPEEGIADYAGVCAALVREIEAAGGVVHTDAPVREVIREGTGNGAAPAAPVRRRGWRLLTPNAEHTARVIVNCAGLYADRVAHLAGLRPRIRIVPFRGEYQRLRPDRAQLVRHLLYPLPEPGFPFLGVHFTRRVDGSVDAGPNAVLAFAREGYRLRDVDAGELAGALSFPGLWNFVRRHPGMVRRELGQSLSRRRFLDALRVLVPEIRGEDFLPQRDASRLQAGVRAQAMTPAGELVHDFQWMEAPGAVHVLNAPSPAATASLAIGREVARRTAAVLDAATR